FQRQAATTDPAPVYARLCVSLAASGRPDPPPRGLRRRRLWRRMAWATAGTAAMLLAFLGGLQFGPGRAGAETLLHQAHAAHLMPLDRCYLVEVRRDAP